MSNQRVSPKGVVAFSSQKQSEGDACPEDDGGTSKDVENIGKSEPHSVVVPAIRMSFPWPPKVLNPNSRPHWTARAVAVRKLRFESRLLTMQQHLEHQEPLIPVEGKLPITVTFYPPDKRHRDADNMLSSCKGLLDGIADGLGINDKRFKITMEMGEPVKYGAVEVTI